jgi:hypothetical protein
LHAGSQAAARCNPEASSKSHHLTNAHHAHHTRLASPYLAPHCALKSLRGLPLVAVSLDRRSASTRQVATAAGAKTGDYVAVQYTGTLDDGKVFDTNRKEGRDLLEFIVGGGRVGGMLLT